MTLPPEQVRRALPTLLDPEDERLFAAEKERSFPSVETRTASGDFFPWGWHQDAAGWKGRLKNLSAVLTTRRTPFVPQPGRTPLVATDRFSNGYFHWVTETLPRLWWLKTDLAGLELIVPAFARRLPYMLQSLELFPELTFRVAEEGARWTLGQALVAPATAPGGNYRPRLVQDVGGAWRRKVSPQAPFRKLYISRSKAARRRIANEAEVKAVLEAQGFETIYCEGLAFADQVRLLAETVHLVSNHGAGLTNLLFMTPGTKVTEIRLKGDTHNNCYFSLARALDLDYDYRLGDPVGASRGAHDTDLRVDPQSLR